MSNLCQLCLILILDKGSLGNLPGSMQPPHVESHKAQSIGQESKQKPWVNQNNLTHSDEKHHASKKLKIWLDPDAWRHLLELSSKKKTKPELKLRKGSHVLQTNNAVLRISMEGRAYQDLLDVDLPVRLPISLPRSSQNPTS